MRCPSPIPYCFLLASLSTLLWALVADVTLGQSEAGDPRARLWTSTSDTVAGQAQELTHLYKTLADVGHIPVRPFKDEEGRPLVEILKDEQLYFENFNATMEEIVCDLNSDHCRPKVTPDAGPTTYSWTNGPGDHVRIPALDFDIQLSTRLHHKKSGGDLSGLLVRSLGACESLDEECLKKIRDLNSDELDVLSPSYEGPMWLPVRRLSVWLDLPENDDDGATPRLIRNLVPEVALPKADSHPSGAETGGEAPQSPLSERLHHETNRFETLSPSSPHLTEARASRIFAPSSSDERFESRAQGRHPAGVPELPPLLVEPGASSPVRETSEEGREGDSEVGAEDSTASFEPLTDSGEGEAAEATSSARGGGAGGRGPVAAIDLRRQELVQRQQEIFSLINLPSEQELAERYGLDENRVPTWVLMIDTQLDQKHCGFNDSLVRAFDAAGEPLDIPAAGRLDCGTPATLVDPYYDHGTHVGSLIAGTSQGSNPMLRGVNPVVRLRAYEKPSGEGNLGERNLWLVKTAELLDTALRDIPRVINLSLDYSPQGLGQNDAVRQKLAQLHAHSLVVVAAGNEGREHHETGSCPRYPACFDLPNILVVGALDLEADEPAMWAGLGANRSDMGSRIHLAAPGERVPGLTPGNQIGALSGTSQAAPQAAGTASLLYAKAHPRYVAPFRVRNRLIYTSDLYPQLHDQLFGGRLNVGRALEVERAVFGLKEGALLKCGSEIHELVDGGELKGRLRYTESPDGSSRSSGFVVYQDHDERYLQFKSVKRMVHRADEDTYLLMIGPQGADTDLERFHAELGSTGRWLWIDVDVGPVEHERCGFEMRFLDDFVAAMPWEEL